MPFRPADAFALRLVVPSPSPLIADSDRVRSARLAVTRLAGALAARARAAETTGAAHAVAAAALRLEEAARVLATADAALTRAIARCEFNPNAHARQ